MFEVQKDFPVLESTDCDVVAINVQTIEGSFTRLSFGPCVNLDYLEGKTVSSLWCYVNYIPSHKVVKSTEFAREYYKAKDNSFECIKYGNNEPNEFCANSGVTVLRFHTLSSKEGLTNEERKDEYSSSLFITPKELGITDDNFDRAKNTAFKYFLNYYNKKGLLSKEDKRFLSS
jgi:hypothetical protein